MNSLQHLGWSPFFEQQISFDEREALLPARVIQEEKQLYTVALESGERHAEISGKFRHSALNRGDFPAVGDWVLVSLPHGRAIIHRVLERMTRLSRKMAGETEDEQVLAANIDVVFIVTSLNRDLNLRRIERTLTLAWQSGAIPQIILTKADLCSDQQSAIDAVRAVARDVEVHAVCSLDGRGLDRVRAALPQGTTAVVIGSSGAGKSTLVNALAGREMLDTGAIREDDDRGRHTTTRRQLVAAPGLGLIIDTPGLRELQLWQGEEGLAETFEDIAALSLGCRFTDCRHNSEPGCAIRGAIESGTLDAARYESFLKLQRELVYHAERGDKRAESEKKNAWKKLHVQARARMKHKYG